MSLFLIRHAQTPWNVEMRAQGSTDIELDEVGNEQARRLGDAFSGVGIRRVITSDLKRSAQTAAAIAGSIGIQAETDTRLRERAFGDWEGLTFTEIGAKFDAEVARLGVLRGKIVPPNGESFEEAWHRVAELATELTGHQDTVIVTHGGICAILLAQLLGGTVPLASAFKFQNAAIARLEWAASPGIWRLLEYNNSAHLQGLKVLAGVADGTRG
jgi:broad specificity phosphatase PhoE